MNNLIEFNYFLDLGKKFYPNIPHINEIDLYKALSFTNKALSIKFNPPKVLLCEAYLLRGKIKSSLHEYEESILDFDRIIEIENDNYLSFFYRGNAKKELNYFSEALEDFDNAIRINSSIASFFIERAFIKTELNMIIEAIDDYNEAIFLTPNNASIFIQKGILESILGNYGEAINNFDNAIKKTQDELDVFVIKNILKLSAEIKYKNNFEVLLQKYKLNNYKN